MATATMKSYGLAPKTLLAKEVNFLSDTIKGMLLTSGYTVDQDTHDYLDDVAAGSNEVSGTGYTAGGQALANKSVTYTVGTNTGKIDAEPFPCSARAGGVKLGPKPSARPPVRGPRLQGGVAAHGRCAPGTAAPRGSATSVRSAVELSRVSSATDPDRQMLGLVLDNCVCLGEA